MSNCRTDFADVLLVAKSPTHSARALRLFWAIGLGLIAFPQIARHFHKNIGRTTGDFQTGHEYLTNQRRRNLPVGESRQGPSGEPATGLAKHSGDWLLMDGIENALTTNGMTEEYGRRGLRSKAPNNSGVTVSCDLGAEPDLRNSESRAI